MALIRKAFQRVPRYLCPGKIAARERDRRPVGPRVVMAVQALALGPEVAVDQVVLATAEAEVALAVVEEEVVAAAADKICLSNL